MLKNVLLSEYNIRSKTYIHNVLLTLKPVIYPFRFEYHYQHGHALLEIFVYPSNKHVIYGPELNL